MLTSARYTNLAPLTSIESRTAFPADPKPSSAADMLDKPKKAKAKAHTLRIARCLGERLMGETPKLLLHLQGGFPTLLLNWGGVLLEWETFAFVASFQL